MKNKIFFQFLKWYKFIFILSIFIVACGKEERANNISTHAASLEKLDSVEVPFRGKFTIHDLDPLYKTVLFIAQEEQPKIVLADFDGQIRASFPSEKLLPDGYGALLAPLKIDGEDSILAYGSNGFLTLDYSGKLLSRVGHIKARPHDSQKLTFGEGMEKSGSRYLHINQGFRNMDQRDKNLSQELRLFVWLNPGTGESEPFVQFPESSIFRQGNFFFKDAWKPVFMIGDDLIFVVFGTEPVVYVYKTSPPYSLVSSLPIDLPEFRNFKGTDSQSFGLNYFELPFTWGKILNIKWVEGYFIIAYFPGFDLRDSKEYSEGKSTRELVSLSREMRGNYPTRIAIVDSLGSTVSDFIPKDLDPENMVLRNGELWMLEKPGEEVERDYFRLFRMGLKFD